MNLEQHIILVRHGRTTWNAEGRFQGQADPPLDEVGWMQARRAASFVAGMAPAAVMSSDLRRAHQTAVVIGARCGLIPATDRNLREVALGTWEGLERAEAAERFPAEYAAWTGGVDVRRGGGETQAEAGARVAAALIRFLWRGRSDGPVVVVSHGLALQGAIDVLNAQGLVAAGADGPPHLGNGEWLVLPVRRAARRPDEGYAA
jgi:broad specificity phosphatase PhoE